MLDNKTETSPCLRHPVAPILTEQESSEDSMPLAYCLWSLKGHRYGQLESLSK